MRVGFEGTVKLEFHGTKVSSVSPTHRQQEGSRYNGHFGCTCFNQDGDVERAMLRHGNVASADD